MPFGFQIKGALRHELPNSKIKINTTDCSLIGFVLARYAAEFTIRRIDNNESGICQGIEKKDRKSRELRKNGLKPL